MDILLGFAVATLKAGVSGAVENEFGQALTNQGINIVSEKLGQYLKKSHQELSQILTVESLRKMNVPEGYIVYVQEEIKELLRSVSLDEDLFRNCRYDAKSLAEALYKRYEEQKKDFIEYKSEIQKVLYVMSEKAILLEKGRDGFTEDILTDIINNQEKQTELLRKICGILDESMKNNTIYLENEQKQDQNKRLPDRTEEYRKKWVENVFLNDFDKNDEDAGVNIPLGKLYQPLFYRLKGQKTDISNLKERLDRCTRGQDIKSRMLLVLGQPGMGKSTMITWLLDWYSKKPDEDKKEILVYRFTDLNIDWSCNPFEEEKRNECIDCDILKCLNMKKQDLNGKILIMDGFDEVAVGNNRAEILNCLYNAWARDYHIKDFSLLITCRENYIEDLSQLYFPYISLQPWNEAQIGNFCKSYGKYAYGKQAELRISREAIEKMKKMRNIFGIPILLYMTLALEIKVRDESSIVEVYDQIFDLETGGLYDRCLKRNILLSYDGVHRIAEIKKQIHQFSRKISVWMFENNPEEAAIPKNEYEKIRDEIFEKNDGVEKLYKKDVLIGNYFRMIHCYVGVDTEKLTFVHRSIYEYFVVETISSEIKEVVAEMTEKSQERLAAVLGYRLKKGRIDYTIGQYLKVKVSTLISEEKKNHFYIWLEETVGKMLNAGMLYYTNKNINEYKNVIEKELICFLNLLDILRLLLDFSVQKYILQNVDSNQIALYIKYLIVFKGIRTITRMDLSRVSLAGANLNGVNLNGVNLNSSDLREAKLSRADLRGVELRGADLKGARLRDAKLIGAKLSKTNLRKSDLREADLSKVDLRESDLREADLRGVNLEETNLGESDLREANLDGANLRQVNLSMADLSKASLCEANLEGANLRGVNLQGANLCEADLRLVRFSKADLTQADLENSKWSQESIDYFYINFIKQSKFNLIYSYSNRTGRWRMLKRIDLMEWFPD